MAQDFGGGSRCRSHFRHDDPRGNIGQFGRLLKVGPRHEGQGKTGNDGVTRTRGVEDLTGCGRHDFFNFSTPCQKHAIRAQGNGEQTRIEFFEDRFHNLFLGSDPRDSRDRPAISKAS